MDWTGNAQAAYSTIGASNRSEKDRAKYDYYATEPLAVKLLLGLETFANEVWEPACGGGHISRELEAAGHKVRSTDLINRGFGNEELDFLFFNSAEWEGDIITNPPYRQAVEFIFKALEVTGEKSKIAMFLKLTFLESKSRKELFTKYPPVRVWVSRERLSCARNGEFDNSEKAIAYAWFIWDKSAKNVIPQLRWFN